MKKFILAILCVISAGCAMGQSRLYGRVKDMVLLQGSPDLANPSQKILISVPTKTMQ